MRTAESGELGFVTSIWISKRKGSRADKMPEPLFVICSQPCNWVECDSYQMVLWYEDVWSIALHGFAFCSKSDCFASPQMSAHPRSPWKEPYGLQAVEVIALSKIVKDLIGTGVDSSDRGHLCVQIMWWMNSCQLMSTHESCVCWCLLMFVDVCWCLFVYLSFPQIRWPLQPIL